MVASVSNSNVLLIKHFLFSLVL